jgi:hypothetical protein
VHHYASLAAGEQAVRQGRADVLVADAQRLEWPGRADQQLKAVVTGAVQLVTVRERAAAAGIGPGAAASLLATVPVTSIVLGHVAGRSSSDETTVTVMTIVLFFCISIFGGMVLNGVLEEKASRVVGVLLARIPARALLAGKIAGIGLLGLAQIGATALAALVAVATVPSVHMPAVGGAALAWAVGRIAMGAAVWWEPVTAAILTLAATAALVLLAGRLYTNAILHTGPRLNLTDAWQTTASPSPGATEAGAHATKTSPRIARAATGGRTTMTRTDLTGRRLLITILNGVGVALGIAVAVLTSDVILGIIAGGRVHRGSTPDGQAMDRSPRPAGYPPLRSGL